jgi:integrase
VHPDQANARKAIAVPLNAEAVVLIRKRLGKHPSHVLSFRGQPIVQVSTKAWYATLEAAGVRKHAHFSTVHLAEYVDQVSRAGNEKGAA